MWAVVIVLLHALSGPQVRVVTQPADEPHVFATEEACKAALDAALPGKIKSEKSLKQYQEGFRRYVCVRISDAEAMKVAK